MQIVETAGGQLTGRYEQTALAPDGKLSRTIEAMTGASDEYGWWEAIVLARTGDMLTLRFRDYPKLPKFARHRAAVALMSPPAE